MTQHENTGYTADDALLLQRLLTALNLHIRHMQMDPYLRSEIEAQRRRAKFRLIRGGAAVAMVAGVAATAALRALYESQRTTIGMMAVAVSVSAVAVTGIEIAPNNRPQGGLTDTGTGIVGPNREISNYSRGGSRDEQATSTPPKAPSIADAPPIAAEASGQNPKESTPQPSPAPSPDAPPSPSPDSEPPSPTPDSPPSDGDGEDPATPPDAGKSVVSASNGESPPSERME